MTEQLNRSTTDQYIPKLEADGSNKTEFRLNRKGRLARTGAATLAIAGLTTGIVAAGNHIFHEEPVGSTKEQILPGEGPISTVDRAAEEIAKQYNLDPDSINHVVDAGREVKGELIANHPGQDVQPHEEITVTVSKNGLGQLSVSADPANLSPLTK